MAVFVVWADYGLGRIIWKGTTLGQQCELMEGSIVLRWKGRIMDGTVDQQLELIEGCIVVMVFRLLIGFDACLCGWDAREVFSDIWSCVGTLSHLHSTLLY